MGQRFHLKCNQANTILRRSPPQFASLPRFLADAEGRILLVRKRATRFFMQPGGKLHNEETATEALAREQELGCTLLHAEFLGMFSAPAANEPLHTVEVLLFSARVAGNIQPAAEIEEMVWVEPSGTDELPLAPLTRDLVLPLILREGGAARVAKRFN